MFIVAIPDDPQQVRNFVVSYVRAWPNFYKTAGYDIKNYLYLSYTTPNENFQPLCQLNVQLEVSLYILKFHDLGIMHFDLPLRGQKMGMLSYLQQWGML